MVNEKIVRALSSLNIPVLDGEIKRKTDKYIIFSKYNNRDIEFVEDKNLYDRYFISLKYYCINHNDKDLYHKIKKLMKNNGFGFDDGEDIPKDGDYYGQELDFTLDINTEEE